MIRSIWNYISLGKHIHSFYVNCQSCSPTESDINTFVDDLIPLIKGCGCVCIKFCQWITPILDTLYNERDKHPSWLTTLETFYENCPDHSIEHTLNQYKQDFGSSFSDTYELLNVIGSGSIGQVYKIKHKFTNHIFAMKVLHPHVHYDMWVFKYICQILLKIPYTHNIIYNVLPYDIPVFIDLFEGQLDMVNEANNLSLMTYHYKDTKHIVKIPSLIKCSSNILIMSYEEGETIDDIDISEYEKMKIISLVALFARQNFQYNNFNHGDFHKGNWKVTKDKKLIIYDFGFCWSLPPHMYDIIDLNYKAFEESTNGDLSNINKLICLLLGDTRDTTLNIVSDYTKLNILHSYSNAPIIFKCLCGIAKRLSIKLNPMSMQGIIMNIQTLKYWTKYNLNNVNEQWTTSKNIYRSDYLNYYTICKTYDIFPQLQQMFKDKLNEKQVEVNELFDMLDESKNITDEVRQLLTFT